MKTPTTTYTTAANVRLAMIESCSLSFTKMDAQQFNELLEKLEKGNFPSLVGLTLTEAQVTQAKSAVLTGINKLQGEVMNRGMTYFDNVVSTRCP